MVTRPSFELNRVHAAAETGVLGQISAGQHGMDTRYSPGARRIDRTDQRMRVWAAHVDRVQHSGLADISRIARAAGDLQVSFDAVLRLGQRVGDRRVRGHTAAAAMMLSTIW